MKKTSNNSVRSISSSTVAASAETVAPRMLYSRKEAARQLSISPRSLDYLIANREIAVRRNGSRILIPHNELVRYARADHYQPIRPVSAQSEAQEAQAA
jgi:excisionase family DNA binding protein